MKRILSVAIALLLLVGCLSLVACNKVADNTEYYDAITKTLKLEKSFEGKSYLTDGIGRATLAALTDGDTTRFTLEQGDSVVVRYYQVDTPESTGGVEKWGKAASLFVKDKLSAATEIVLEATAVPAEKESYGRYLGYVWYKTAADEDFKNLNLELVENGFSENKGINTSAYPYYDVFQKANDFAQKIKLRLYSELDDPLFSTDPVEMTIKEFNESPDAFFNEELDVGSKVLFYGYLSDLEISQSQTYTFTATQYDETTGETYNIKVYAAYSSNPASKMKLGHYYRFVGTVQEYQGQFQISGIVYDSLFQLEEYSYVTQKDYYLTFSSSETFINQYSATLYTDITVTSANVENGTLTIVGTAQQRTQDGVKEEVKTFTLTVKVDSNYSNEITVGSKISVSGLQLVANSGNITVLHYSDIDLK